MNATELRIGNWVVVDGKNQEWDLDWFHSMAVGQIYEEDLSPIQLTPEILEKCGFSLCEDVGNWHFKDYKIYRNENWFYLGVKSNEIFWYNCVGDDYYSSMSPKILYLHQLQNVISLLTGKELEINL